MKKRLILVTSLFFLVFLAGCSKQDATSDTTDGSTTNTVAKMQEGNADIKGVVKSITGNEVTVAKVDVGEMQGSMQNQDSEQEQQTATNLSGVLGGTTTRVPGMGGGSGMGGGPGGDMDQDAIVERMLSQSTENVKVIVPVGIEMFKNAEDEEGNTILEVATFADLEEGSIVNIWLNDEVTDRKVAESVTLRSFDE